MDYDAELRAHNVHLRRAAAIQAGEAVLDIGCGAGQTTREAARAAAPGRVLGVDVSEPMLERARALTAAERLENVAYELGDAQSHRFAAAHYDVAISRFGTMFFSDPVEAFRNITRALRPGGRVALLVWQARERNEWAQAIGAAVEEAALEDGPFSLGDPAVTTGILEHAGLRRVGFADVHEPMFFGPDVEAALEWVTGFQSTRDALAALDGAGAARALDRLRDTLAARHGREGVVFDSRAWVVTARRVGSASAPPPG
jgi:SAM-dependent methyltransferase